MKIILKVLLIALPLIGKSQITDTTCIESRWISIKPMEANKNIFLQNEKDTVDLVYTLKKLVENEKINTYNQSHAPELNRNIKTLFNFDFRDSYCEDAKYPSSESYYEIIQKSKEPYLTMYLEDSVIISPDGTETIVYPPPVVYPFMTREFNEIRIKESRVYNESLKRYEFIPVGLSIYYGEYTYHPNYKMFWVDIEELFNAIEEKDKYPWYEAIKNKEYQGFQFMQTPCKN